MLNVLEVRVLLVLKNNMENCIFEGDCLNFLREIPARSFQLVFTSPPYNLGKEYEKSISIDEYVEQQSIVIAELHRTLSDTGSICWQVGNYVNNGEVIPLDFVFYPIFKNLGMTLKNRIIWKFDHGLHAKNRFSGRYETVLWFTKTEDYKFNLDSVRVPSKYPGKRHYKGPNKGLLSGNPLGKNPSDIWDILNKDWSEGIWNVPNVKSNHCEKTSHPCQFPVELAERCVLALTDPGDVVFDPYGGVGSTLIAAVKNDRIGVVTEINSKYCEIARQRFAEFKAGSLKIRSLGKPIHVPSGKLTNMPDEWTVQN